MQVYLGNLAPEVDEPLLHELISHIAPVHSVRLPRNKAVPPSHQGYGFAQFGTEADAEYVLNWLNSQPPKLFDRIIKGKPASKSPPNRSKSSSIAPAVPKYTKRIFVGNLRPEVAQNVAGLRIPFEKFGKISNVEFVVSQPNQPTAHAFVTMADPAAARAAIEALNQQTILNSKVRVEFER